MNHEKLQTAKAPTKTKKKFNLYYLVATLFLKQHIDFGVTSLIIAQLNIAAKNM